MLAYKCTVCGKTGVKLWREYQSFQFNLHCGQCALARAKRNETFSDLRYRGPISPEGTVYCYTDDGNINDQTDSIGWMVPAVMDEDGNAWGYTSSPHNVILDWRKLPNE